MIKARYQKMYTEKYKQDMDFVIIGDYCLGPFVDMDVAQKAVSAINNLYNQLSPKPRTEPVYEKVTFNEDYEHLSRMIKGESFYDCRGEIKYKFNGYGFVCTQGCSEYKDAKWDTKRPTELYRQIEVEVDWREELNKWQHTEKIGIYTPLDFEVSTLIETDPDKFLEMCRVALRATGELE